MRAEHSMNRAPIELLIVRTVAESAVVNQLCQFFIERFEGSVDAPFARVAGMRVRVVRANFDEHLRRARLRTERIAVMPLVDENLAVNPVDQALKKQVESIGNDADVRVFPVSLVNNGFAALGGGRQFLLRGDDQASPQRIAIALMQECIAWLRGRGRDARDPALEVFISHAKRDGEGLALGFRNALEQNWRIQGFFDARDIPAGADWRNTLHDSAGRGAMLIVQTDAYSQREWCQREIEIAKHADLPIVVVNALREGESRSFPYLGNLRTIRVDPDQPDAERVLFALLEDCLRADYHRLLLGKVDATIDYSPRPPELWDLPRDGVTLVYPDPPISLVEREALPAAVRAVTISQFRLNQAAPQSGALRRVALSISDPSNAEVAELGLTGTHVDLFWMQINRALLAQGASIAYGGDHRAGGHTERLSNLIRAYHREGMQAEAALNYLAEPLAKKVDWSREVQLLGALKLIRCDLPAGVSGETAYANARAFTEMRRRMAAETELRIVCGGKVKDFQGRYAGIAEEALLHLEAGKPVLVVGALGGCAAELGRWRLGGEINPLLWRGEPTSARNAMIADYSRVQQSDIADSVYDPDRHGEQLRTWLRESADAASSRFCGLDAADLDRLAETDDFDLALTLIAKAIHRLAH